MYLKSLLWFIFSKNNGKIILLMSKKGVIDNAQ